MDKYKDFRKSGLFKFSSDVEVPGELSLNSGATSLDLYSTSFFSTHGSQDIVGVFHDRSKVSLIDCITMSGPGWGTRVEAKIIIISRVSFRTSHFSARSTSRLLTER
ncbi:MULTISPECIES: hypothetical protein [Thiomonas]|uniref:ApeA N-terminal domain 1-containing protein n=1 Tax=Thiomonas TaxID=32012 RepID=UPI0039C926C2